MRVDVVGPAELGDTHLDRWAALQRAQPGLDNPFLSAGFARAVGRHRPDARVAVVDDGAGFLAFQRRRLGVAVPIAAGVSDAQAYVGEGDAGHIETLLSGARLQVFEYDHLIGAQAPPGAARHASPHVDMPSGFDSYFEERRAASSRVAKTARQRRKLEREVGPVTIDPGPHPPEELERLLSWKSAQYRRSGMPDVLSRPWARGLIDDLLAERTPDCQAGLWVLRAGDRAVASALILRHGSFASGWVQAYDPEMSRHSPGWHLVLALLEALAPLGVERLDLGRGDQPYKNLLKTGASEVTEGTLSRRSPAGRMLALRREPRRRAEAFVIARPALRHAARRTLRGIGRARTGS